MDSPDRPPVLRRLVISVVAVLVALAVGSQVFLRLKALKEEPERRAGGSRPPSARVVKVVRGDHREVLRGYGVARAMRQAVVAAEVGGIVRRVSPDLEVGRLVEPPSPGRNGEDSPSEGPKPLVVIDPEDLQDRLARLAAERQQGVADIARLRKDISNKKEQLEVMGRRLDTARNELRRILSLVEDTHLPESDADRQRLAVFALEQAEAEIEARRDEAEAQVAGVEARLAVVDANERTAKRDLTRTRVYAPYTGRVMVRHVEVGVLVAPGTPLFELVDPTRLEVAISLPAGRYGQVHAPEDGHSASRVVLRSGEGGPPVWEGAVVRVDPLIDVDARAYRVFVEVDDPDGTLALAPGSHVVAEVEGVLHRGVLPIPREAFVDDSVYVCTPPDENGESVAQERRPTVRRMLLGIALVEPDDPEGQGVRHEALVVVSNLEDVADGSRVRVVFPDAEAGGR